MTGVPYTQQISLIIEEISQLFAKVAKGLGRSSFLWRRPTKSTHKHNDLGGKKQAKKVVYIHRVPVKASTRAIPSKTKNLL